MVCHELNSEQYKLHNLFYVTLIPRVLRIISCALTVAKTILIFIHSHCMTTNDAFKWQEGYFAGSLRTRVVNWDVELYNSFELDGCS